MKSVLAASYSGDINRVSLHSADPGTTGASEISGGSPAYARKAPGTITTNGTGLTSFSVTFDVPAGTTVAGVGLWDAGATFLDGGTVTSTTFASQGTYTVTVSYQQN